MRDAFVRTVLVMVATVLLVTGCKEDFESRYPTVEAAAQAGAFKRGWLPAVLQPDATEIQEWHDLDSNKVRGRFALNDSVLYHSNAIARFRNRKLPLVLVQAGGQMAIREVSQRRTSMWFVVMTTLLRLIGKIELDIFGQT
ncbi:MAG: hypothetical protein QOJ51_2580 [Acidobacteriaceae bacterium]|nr:hypothetical protein [Acidobacteriaceae bacterium]